jgi:hypothetical protein
MTYGIYIQYWCIDGKYRIYVARLRNGGKTRFSESSIRFVPLKILDSPVTFLCMSQAKIVDISGIVDDHYLDSS